MEIEKQNLTNGILHNETFMFTFYFSYSYSYFPPGNRYKKMSRFFVIDFQYFDNEYLTLTKDQMQHFYHDKPVLLIWQKD